MRVKKRLFTELRLYIEKEERFLMGIPQQNTEISTTRYARGNSEEEG